MQVSELVCQVKERMEQLKKAEQEGVEVVVVAHLVMLRELLNRQSLLEAGSG